MMNSPLLHTAILSLALLAVQDIRINNGDTIVFFGDSITQMASRPEGFITAIKESLGTKFDTLNIVNAGISGNKVTDLRKRLASDVLSRKPSLVIMYIGINDVWHNILPGLHGTPKQEFDDVLRSVIVDIRRTGARVVLCTPSVVGELPHGTNQLDGDLDAYAAISRTVAKELNVPLCDLRTAFIDYLKDHNPDKKVSGILTYDRVHLSDEGNRLVARELLKVLMPQ